MKRMIPWAMVWARALGGPLMVLAAWRGTAGWVLAVAVLAGLVDDILDGMLARQWNCETPALRLADSSAVQCFIWAQQWRCGCAPPDCCLRTGYGSLCCSS
jgi:hypothetical protein